MADEADITAFRAYYPEFSDTDTWPDGAVSRFLDESDGECGRRWGNGDLRKRGRFAYTAHRLSLWKAAARAVEAGQSPGATGAVTSKSVADESVTYATYSPTSQGESDTAGDFRSTVYGQEFLRLRSRAAAGAATTASGNVPRLRVHR